MHYRAAGQIDQVEVFICMDDSASFVCYFIVEFDFIPRTLPFYFVCEGMWMNIRVALPPVTLLYFD